MTTETRTTHTPGPLEACNTAGSGWKVRRKHEHPGYTGLAPICSMAWWQFDIPGIIDDEISAANARLLAAAYTSYDRHFGPAAADAAENDVLGALIEACQEAEAELRFISDNSPTGTRCTDETLDLLRAVLAKLPAKDK